MDLSKINGSKFEKVFDDVDIKKYPFIKKEEIVNQSFSVKSVYLTKSTYGFQSVLILSKDDNGGYRVGFGGRELFDNIISDNDIVNAIKNSSMTCKIISYENKKYKKVCYKPYFEVLPF